MSKSKPVTIEKFLEMGYDDIAMESTTPFSAEGRQWVALRSDGTKEDADVFESKTGIPLAEQVLAMQDEKRSKQRDQHLKSCDSCQAGFFCPIGKLHGVDSGDRGLWNKYFVARNDGRPLKGGGCVVLEFGDPRAHAALLVWAATMEAEGRAQLAEDVRGKVAQAKGAASTLIH